MATHTRLAKCVGAQITSFLRLRRRTEDRNQRSAAHDRSRPSSFAKLELLHEHPDLVP